MCFRYALLLFCLSQSALFAESKPLLIGIAPNDVIDDYKRFLNGRSPHEIQKYDGQFARRDVIEIVLTHQLLAQTPYKLKLKPIRTYSRLLEELKQGRADLSMNSVWLEDLDKSPKLLLKTKPLIREGEFEAGLYTNSKELIQLKPEQFKASSLTAVSNRNWRPDWRLLSSLHLKSLLHTQNWDSMVRLVHSGRADFLLAPLNVEPLSPLRYGQIQLRPIPNLKVQLLGSRHLAISQASKHKSVLLHTINGSIAVFRKREQIVRAYRECGFFCEKAENWQALAPSQPMNNSK